MNIKFHILPVFGFFCFVSAWFIFITKDNYKDQNFLKEHYSSDIQSNMDKISLDLKNEVSRATEHFIAGDSKLFNSNKAIYFLENGQLVHWTDYHIPYNTNFGSGNLNWHFVKTTQGLFLVYKHNIIRHNSFNQIIGVIDFYRDYHLSSDYLHAGYNKEIFNNYNVTTDNKKSNAILNIQGELVWNYNLVVDDYYTKSIKITLFILCFLGFACFFVYALKWFFYFNKSRNFIKAVFLLITFMFTTRFSMFYFNFPLNQFDFKLFDPTIYASSNINASFGDLFLNIICCSFLFLYLYYLLIRSKVYHTLLKLSNRYRMPLAFLFSMFSSFVSIWLYIIFESIYRNSQVIFDITESLHLDMVELLYLGVFGGIIIIYFLVNHFVLKSLHILLRKKRNQIILILTIQLVLFSLVECYFFDVFLGIVGINFLFLFISIVFELFKDIRDFQYKTYLYFTFTAVTCALMVSFIVVEESEVKSLAQKKRFSEHLILHNDIQGEVIMSEIANHVKSDEEISNNLVNGFVRKEAIEQRIREKYISNYFDKYEIHFSYFNKLGMPYFSNELIGNLAQIKTNNLSEEHKTWLDNLYFITNLKKDFFSVYYHFLDINVQGEYVGTIVIDYTLKKYIGKSILPGLLKPSSIGGYNSVDRFNYAIFNKDELQYSVGDFNYNSPDFKSLIKNNSKLLHDFKLFNYHHYLDTGVMDKRIVVSSEINYFYRIITNFSFHFLLLVFCLLVYVIISSILYFLKNRSTDFSTKIQTYLNISTFAPMIFLSVLILSLMASSYRKDQELQFKNSADILSSHVLGYLEEYNNQKMSLFDFKNAIDKLSKYSGTDINIYDPKGTLMISNQPLLYEAGVISNLINPEAKKELFEMKHRMVNLEENIGDFKYNTVYVALRTPESSDFMGVMSIPFFNSSQQMEMKKISALSIIINVFAVAFVLLLVASFFVTKSLTSPLRLIANKLRKVETGNKNEPLYWNSNDELGLLITEYNQMLQKIEDSKQTFAQTEKESAWKEMAKQVAHEIKNPLTPMKLKLQHLRRVIGVKDNKTNEAIDSLLEQVDSLSEIASSFSTFAKMPIPEFKKINLSEVCNHVIDLYENNDEYEVLSDIENNVFVLADDKMIGRIITNLLLNGIQSVSLDKKPVIFIQLKLIGTRCLISVKDNGTGIPDEVINKVFVPNFTTKYTGSGIGLAVAKNGIEQMGGKIWFETSNKKGTVFFIELEKI